MPAADLMRGYPALASAHFTSDPPRASDAVTLYRLFDGHESATDRL